MSWSYAGYCHACGRIAKYPLRLPASKRTFCDLECLENHATGWRRRKPQQPGAPTKEEQLAAQQNPTPVEQASAKETKTP